MPFPNPTWLASTTKVLPPVRVHGHRFAILGHVDRYPWRASDTPPRPRSICAVFVHSVISAYSGPPFITVCYSLVIFFSIWLYMRMACVRINAFLFTLWSAPICVSTSFSSCTLQKVTAQENPHLSVRVLVAAGLRLLRCGYLLKPSQARRCHGRILKR